MCCSNCVTSSEGRKSLLLENSEDSQRTKEALSTVKRGLVLVTSRVCWVCILKKLLGRYQGTTYTRQTITEL